MNNDLNFGLFLTKHYYKEKYCTSHIFCMVFYGLLDGNVVTVYISCIENAAWTFCKTSPFLHKKIWNSVWVSK